MPEKVCAPRGRPAWVGVLGACVCARARSPACGCVNAWVRVDLHGSVGVSQVLSQPVPHTLPFPSHLGLENWSSCPPLVGPASLFSEGHSRHFPSFRGKWSQFS